jgi:hypothetical protein
LSNQNNERKTNARKVFNQFIELSLNILMSKKYLQKVFYSMSKKYFCPNCGSSIAPEDKFCLNCGQKLTEDFTPAPKAQATPAPAQSGPVTAVQPAPYPYAQPAPQAVSPANYIQLKAGMLDRFLALLIDGVLYNLCPPLWCFRDVIPEKGKSFGKSIMSIRVVDYDTGQPITVGQSCVRTLCLGVLFGIDYLVPLCNEEGRRIGDYLAGTIVLEDR